MKKIKNKMLNKHFVFLFLMLKLYKIGSVYNMRRRNIILEEKYEECWIYILLLTTLVIFISSLKAYTFTLLGVELTYAVLFLPLIYFIVNYHTSNHFRFTSHRIYLPR